MAPPREVPATRVSGQAIIAFQAGRWAIIDDVTVEMWTSFVPWGKGSGSTGCAGEDQGKGPRRSTSCPMSYFVLPILLCLALPVRPLAHKNTLAGRPFAGRRNPNAAPVLRHVENRRLNDDTLLFGLAFEFVSRASFAIMFAAAAPTTSTSYG